MSILQHDTEKRKGNSKSNKKALTNGTRAKQAIQTLNQHSYLVFPSGSPISVASQDLYY